MKMKYTLFLSLAVLLFSGCDKDDDEPAPKEYAPMTAGSTWTYEIGSGGTNTMTATSKDTVINTRTYRVFTNTMGANSYQAKSGSDYYRFGEIEGLPGMEELFLKDNVEVNGSWSWTQTITMPGVPFPLTVNFGYTIREKGLSHTVLGKNYTDVIKVGLTVNVSGFGSVGTGEFYYARGIGMIENTVTLTASGTAETESQKLVSYDIR